MTYFGEKYLYNEIELLCRKLYIYILLLKYRGDYKFMSECAKTIIKVYSFILIITYILLGNLDFEYMCSIVLILNSTIGICGFLVNKSYFDINKDNMYKYISFIFAFTGIINLVNALSRLSFSNNLEYISISRHISATAIGLEVILFIWILNYKKELNMKNLVNIAIIFTIASLFIICKTSLIPEIYTSKGLDIFVFLIYIVYVLGMLYILKNLRNISNRVSKRTLRDLLIYSITRILHLIMLLIFSIIIRYFNFPKMYLSILILGINIIYSICMARICYMDIIRRPNQMLYRNLLREKEKLEEASKELKDYKNRYEEVLMHLPDGVIVYEDGIIVFANEKINEFFNLYDSSHILGKTLDDIVDIKEKEIIKDIFNTEKPIIHSNLKYKFNGIDFYGEQTTIIKKKKNKILCISIIKNMEDKIKFTKIKEELEYNKTMEEIKNQVLSNISHDFKTPINVIYSTAQVLDLNIKNKNYDNLIEFNRMIKQNCNRLIRLTNNFIDSIKLENDIPHVNLKYVNIVSLVEDITTSVLNYAKDKNINLIFDTAEEEIYSSTDVEFMEKIMLNLLSNAIKYNKENGSIEVKIEETKQLIIIVIKDTGVGIPKHQLKTIFERFERAERNTIKTKEGSGIGLSIVKQMVEALNGAIDISSVENKGTMVKLIFQKDDKAKTEEYEDDIELLDKNQLDEKTRLELSDI